MPSTATTPLTPMHSILPHSGPTPGTRFVFMSDVVVILRQSVFVGVNCVHLFIPFFLLTVLYCHAFIHVHTFHDIYWFKVQRPW